MTNIKFDGHRFNSVTKLHEYLFSKNKNMLSLAQFSRGLRQGKTIEQALKPSRKTNGTKLNYNTSSKPIEYKGVMFSSIKSLHIHLKIHNDEVVSLPIFRNRIKSGYKLDVAFKLKKNMSEDVRDKIVSYGDVKFGKLFNGERRGLWNLKMVV